ncbi:MAG: hypothetical protein IJS54_01685 [Desulfovibrio sp.]|nr:hypothetical protein [Desulfovibrio sp.]
MNCVTLEEMMNSLPPERRNLIEEMVEAVIDALGLRDLANQLRGKSSNEIVHRTGNTPFHTIMNEYIGDKVMQGVN